MTRVCVVCDGLPPFYGGAQRRAYQHTHRLREELGVDTILIGWVRPGYHPPGSFPDNVYAVKLRYGEYAGIQDPVHLAKTTLHLSEIVLRLAWLLYSLRHSYDVVHIINAVPWFNLLAIPIARRLGKSVILEMVLLGSDDPLTLNKRSHRPDHQVFPHRPVKYSLFRTADNYVSKSHAISQAYLEAGLPGTRLWRIPSGVNEVRFRPASEQEKEALRIKLGLSPELTLLLYVGGIEERKGPHWFLEAFRSIAAQQPDTHVLMVGPSSDARFNATFVRKLHENTELWGLSRRVTYVDKVVENVHDYLRASDIFVLPTIHEGFSMAILEAMACGLGIVTSDIPEIALSQIRHGVEGLLVTVGHPSRLAEAIVKMVVNTELRVSLGKAARQRVLREFTLDTIGSQYVHLYEKVLEQQGEKS